MVVLSYFYLSVCVQFNLKFVFSVTTVEDYTEPFVQQRTIAVALNSPSQFGSSTLLFVELTSRG